MKYSIIIVIKLFVQRKLLHDIYNKKLQLMLYIIIKT